MSPQNSRKTFFAQLLGVFAGIGLVPKLFAKSATPASAPVAKTAPFTLRSDPRAIARAGES